MKKTIYLSLFFILLTLSVKAQYKPFQFGLKVSPGFSWIKTDMKGLDGVSNEFNLNWGFAGNFYFVENYGINTGFDIISVKGSYLFDSNPMEEPSDGEWRNDINLKYVQIPIGLKMRTSKVGDFRIFGEVAYGLGFLLSDKTTTYKDDVEYVNDVKYKNIRNALIVKLGLELIVLKSSCVTAAVSLNDNFTNIVDGGSLNHNIKGSSINFEIGFMF